MQETSSLSPKILHRWPSSKTFLVTLGEILLIVFWAVWVTRDYLDFNPDHWPQGGDFPLTVQSYYVWQYLAECGSCVFWNGFANGGNPAFVEAHGAFLHPLVIATTLIWGVINGAKVTLIICFALAGIAQWWLAKAMNLHLIARLWAAALAVVGGHLSTRMEIGLVAVILSTAFASLTLVPLLKLGLTGKRRYALLLGAFTALTLLSGQGYIQISLLIALLSGVVIFSMRRKGGKSVLKEFILAGLITVLLTGFFWVPFLHFFPNFVKDTETTLLNSQPFEYQAFNLVIHDPSIYESKSLAATQIPGLYMNYIGVTACGLALVGLYFLYRMSPLMRWFLIFPPFLIFLVSSRQGLETLVKILPDFVYPIRYPSLMNGLAIPFILALAAFGLDGLLRQRWDILHISIASDDLMSKPLSLPIFKLILLVVLGLSIQQGYGFSKDWLIWIETPPEYQKVVEALKTETAQWVQTTPEVYWYPYLFESGMKAVYAIRPWHWYDRIYPFPQKASLRKDEPDPHADVSIFGFQIYTFPTEYASIKTANDVVPCRALARAGSIEVQCQTEQPGILTVQENNWTGWTASLEGNRIPLDSGPWLQVNAPAGNHTYLFHYRPWDAPVGILLTLLGISLTLWLWVKSPQESLRYAQHVPFEQYNQPYVPL